jgi:hypothetical protein
MTNTARARRVGAAIATTVASLVLLSVLTVPATAATPVAKLIKIRKTSTWHKPSTDPTGLGYIFKTDQLVVCDSEVEETNHWKGANVWITSLTGRVQRSFSTLAYSSEPTDCAMRKPTGPLFVTDDSQDKVFVVHAGPDNKIGTKDDIVSSFSTHTFNSKDPNGIDVAGHSLLVSDGNNGTAAGPGNAQKVFRIKPGPDGVFDGAAPAGDDVVTSWDTAALGIREPEGVAYDPPTKRVVLVSGADDVIVVATLKGKLVKTFDISTSGMYHASACIVGPGSFNRKVRHVYVADRGVDNNSGTVPNPDENDGRIFEFGIGKAV